MFPRAFGISPTFLIQPPREATPPVHLCCPVFPLPIPLAESLSLLWSRGGISAHHIDQAHHRLLEELIAFSSTVAPCCTLRLDRVRIWMDDPTKCPTQTSIQIQTIRDPRMSLRTNRSVP